MASDNRVLLFTHAAMLDHCGPPGHPERPERLSAVLTALEGLDLDRRAAPIAERAWLERAHPPAYIDALEHILPKAGEGLAALDGGDTFVSPGTREAAWRAAGGVVAAVDAVLAGQATRAFCAVRPPGHHAEPAQPMGFCLFNNVVVGAMHALDGHGVPRVAVVDFDVHHGNGTQARAEIEPRLFFASTHQSPLYPGTGRREERGSGNVVNAPLPPGADGRAFRAAMEREVLPALEAFAPGLIFISAGFDAHDDDPLAALALEEQDFAWAGQAIGRIAELCCNGRVVSVLEGGYDLAALGRSAAAFVRSL
jgi:acetoin utilization deacetylase AcuC-like enzyme